MSLLFARQKLGAIGSKVALLGGAISVALLVVTVLIGGSFDYVEQLIDQFVSSGITELQTQKGGALQGREAFARERRTILKGSPYVGYGFIDKDSKAGILFNKQVIGDTLGFIDKGDVDVALKFGYLGQALLYGTIMYLSWGLIRIARQNIHSLLSVRCLALAVTAVVFIIVQPVHAPLTYSFGLLPFGIAVGLIDRERMISMGKSS
jgi:hypothetical protein